MTKLPNVERFMESVSPSRAGSPGYSAEDAKSHRSLPDISDAAIHVPVERPKARTYDDGKEPLAHLPWAAMDELAMVQAYGESKYGDFYNYRKGMEISRNLSCALRHIRDYMNGVDRDHESGLNPLAHALCRISFVIQNLHDGKAIDDRYKRRIE